jgi:predicted lysophospholipase L1 biosynthesis ABC-type transport system permease subunit
VVGVVEDTRYRSFLEPRPAAYFPLARMSAIPPSRLLVRTSRGGPASLAAPVERALSSVVPGVRVLREERLTEVLARPAARPRFAAAVLGFLALTTLVLAAFGVYGVFSTLVQERTREMGLRRALGAPSEAVERVVLAGVVRVAGVGALAGVLISAWASRLLQSILHGVGGTDPATFVAVTVGALAMAVLAGTGPARRAGEADPAVLLRSE